MSLVGCGASEAGGASSGTDAGAFGGQDAAPSNRCFSSNECPTGFTCSDFGVCEPPATSGGIDAGAPPEVEQEFSAPNAALRYMYVGMADLDALAKIDGATLDVTAVPVGDRPDVMATVPGTDDVVVLDRTNAAATIVRPTVDHDQRITVRTLPRLNQISVDPTGRFAVAWFDIVKASQEVGGLAPGSLGGLQDITLIGLSQGGEKTVDLSVGFRPRGVAFDAAGTRAFVVTDDGVSVIDLAPSLAGGASVRAPISLTSDPLDDPRAAEVQITSDGAFAVVRQGGQAELRVVTLAGVAAGDTRIVPLPGEPTDVDLSPDGTHAYAVVRTASVFAVVEIATGATDLVDLGGQPFGSATIDPGATRAVLFTNAIELPRVVVVDLTRPGFPHAVRALRKGVRTVAFAPDGKTAIVMHSKQPGDPATAPDLDQFVARSFGYSVLDIASGFGKLVTTPVAPGDLAFAPAGGRAYIALDGGDVVGAPQSLEIVDLATFAVDDVPLGARPEHVGVLPKAGVAFVSQRHPLGRVTFVDLVTSATRTLTGFELNSHIVD